MLLLNTLSFHRPVLQRVREMLTGGTEIHW